jgi:anti-anti-sigma factor
MKLERKSYEDAELLLVLSGDFDAAGTTAIRPELEQVAAQPGPADVILDIAGVSFLDSSGVGAIVFLFKRLRMQNRRLRIRSPRGQPAQLLELLRVHKAIPIELSQPAETAPCVA